MSGSMALPSAGSGFGWNGHNQNCKDDFPLVFEDFMDMVRDV